jgi:hypothetical protein
VRPRQVTLAAWVTMVGSVIVVLLVFQRIAGLHSLETRQAVEQFVSRPPGEDLGVGTEAIIATLRALAMVAAACATAAGILGYHVLRRSRAARLGVTVLAVPLFLSGFTAGGFVSALVAFSAVMLWLPPAREWFGDAPVERAAAPGSPPAPARAGPGAPAPHLWGPPASPAPYPPPARTAAARRPAAVMWACVLTWVLAGLTALTMLLGAVAIAVDTDQLLDEMHRQNPRLAEQGVSDSALLAVAYVLVGVVVLWCLAAAVVAVLVLRGAGWARVALLVSASATAVLCLVATVVGAFLLVLPLIGGVATVTLLLRPDSRAWFARH